MKGYKRHTILLPDDLFEKIQAEAKENNRATGPQIRHILEGVYNAEESPLDDIIGEPADLITQGGKGQKLPRINMAFQPYLLEYLQIISRVAGESITKYVNDLVRLDRRRKFNIYERGKELFKEMG
jgi:hypothetical protein